MARVRVFISLVALTFMLASVAGLGGDTSDVTVGIILVGSRTDAGYSQQHAEDIRAAAEATGARLLPIVDNVGDDVDVFERAVRSLIAQGADIVFGASATFQRYLADMAPRFPNVVFEFTDPQVMEPMANLRGYYGRWYEGNYVLGFAMGRQLALDEAAGRDLSGASVGLISSVPFPLTVRNSYAVVQGVRDGLGWDIPGQVLWLASVSPENPWYNPDRERALTEALLDAGAVAVHTYLDSPAPVLEVQERGTDAGGWPLYVAGVNRDYRDRGPDVAAGFAVISWKDYYIQQINAVANETWEPGSTWASFGEVPQLMVSPMGVVISDEVQDEVLQLIEAIASGAFIVLEQFDEDELLGLMQLPEGVGGL